jgi:hypothetical protein
LRRARAKLRGLRREAEAMARLWTLLLALALAGCVNNDAPFPGLSRYHGTDVELFFLEWGGPVAERDRKLPGKEYLWYSGRGSAYKPGHVDTELIGNTAWWRGYRQRFYNPLLECRVRLITDAYGVIEEIRPQDGSGGWWARCREVFGPPVP